MAPEPITTTTIAKILTPFTKSIVDLSKDTIKSALSRWEEKDFPERLAKQIINLNTVRTLWSRREDVFLLNFYYPSKVVKCSSNKSNKKKPYIINTIDDFKDGHVVIEGIVGQGKSMLARYLAIQEVIKVDNKRLPIFIELRKLTKENTLEKAIFNVLSTYDIEIDKKSYEKLAADGRFTIFLDGFDELDEGLIKDTLIYIDYFIHKFYSVRLIITTRPDSEISKVAGFTIYKIASLVPNDYIPFLEKLDIEANYIASIIKAINESPLEIKEFITTPLMLTLVMMVYQSEHQIPQNIPKFFETLFDVVFTTHDLLKSGFRRARHSKLSDDEIKKFFSAFCFICLKEKYGRTLTNLQFQYAFTQASKYLDYDCNADSFRGDLVKTSCLMLDEGIDAITFLHKSLLEYYAASFVKNNIEKFAEKFYHYVANNEGDFIQVLTFLKEIDSYRYQKYYILAIIDDFSLFLSNAMIKKDKISFIELLDKLFPKITFGFSPKENSNLYTCEVIGPFRNRNFLHNFFEVIIMRLSEHEMLITDLYLNSEASYFGEIVEYSMILSQLVSHVDINVFWEKIDGITMSIDKIKIDAQRIIADYEKNVAVFDF